MHRSTTSLCDLSSSATPALGEPLHDDRILQARRLDRLALIRQLLVWESGLQDKGTAIGCWRSSHDEVPEVLDGLGEIDRSNQPSYQRTIRAFGGRPTLTRPPA